MPDNQKKCAYCHAILFEDDDVVFCPDCGAPHHRECYAQIGECARKALHGIEAPEPEPQPQSEEQARRPEGVPFDREGHICRRCGKRSTSDTLFCPYCATPFVEAGQSPFGSSGAYQYGFAGADPYGGVDPAGDIDGVPVREMASFVRNNTQRYIPLFKKMASTGKKTAWNWSAFLFGPLWLIYRKCYREGFAALLFSMISTVMAIPWTLSTQAFINKYAFTYNDLFGRTEAAMDNVAKLIGTIPAVAWWMMAASWVVSIIISVVIGIYGDHLYMNRVKKRISQIKEDDRFEDKTSAISMAGGCNILSAVAVHYLTQVVTNFLILFFI